MTGNQPLTAGMSAALPHVDAFVSGHSMGALDEVVAAIAGSFPHPVPLVGDAGAGR